MSMLQELLKRPVGYPATTAVWTIQASVNAGAVAAGMGLVEATYDWAKFVLAMNSDRAKACSQAILHQMHACASVELSSTRLWA